MKNLLDQGGSIMHILLVMSISGMTIILWKLLSISKFRKKINEMAQDMIQKEMPRNFTFDPLLKEVIEGKVENKISGLGKGLDTLKIIATTSPLLGLLGTVWGILTAFKMISEKGFDNPEIFADGLYLALITTVGGLVVAIPALLAHNYLQGYLECLHGRFYQSIVEKIYNLGKKENEIKI